MVREELARGKKLLLKPNLVNPICIDPREHGAGMGYTTCTAWPFIAALMRWLHDRLDVSYRRWRWVTATVMASSSAFFSRDRAGSSREANWRVAPATSTVAGASISHGSTWRRHDASHDDDNQGYDDSIAGNTFRRASDGQAASPMT
jgi:hypothetical protein